MREALSDAWRLTAVLVMTEFRHTVRVFPGGGAAQPTHGLIRA